MTSCSRVDQGTCEWNDARISKWYRQDGSTAVEEDTYDLSGEIRVELLKTEGKAGPESEPCLDVEAIRAEDVLQMEFSNPEDASAFYNNYSLVKGFTPRQGKKIRNSSGQIIRYTFVCNRQGYREKKWLEKKDRKREHKIVTRCGCLAEMRINRKDGSRKWYVSRFVDEHNHDLLLGKFVNYLSRHRKISEVEVAQLTSMREIGISIPKIYESFATQVGGFNKVPFTKQDMYNEVRRQRALQDGDMNATIRFLEGVARVDGRMFWRYKLGSNEHLSHLFWSDGKSREVYAIFGDVLAFDATYGRNKYNLPVVVFSGVNHHNQTCVFATALVSCESQDSYVWVLQQFLECMNGKAPQSVITDGDPAMRLAIQTVFPESHHRLCAWLLLRNATSNICDPRFTHLLRHCMLADLEVDEFELHWQSMVNECGVSNVEWVKDMYKKKLSWATTYIRGRFFAGIRTTSRCESLHAKLGRFVESRYGVLEFVTNFQRCVDFLRDNEEELEFQSVYGTPVLQTEFVELEKAGWSVFTREIFWRYREALRRCVRVRICSCKETDQGHVYTLQKYCRPERSWEVTREIGGGKLSCTCMRMESFGIPCIHILCVCVSMDMMKLPESLVLRRWSKAAKVNSGLSNEDLGTEDQAATYRTRLGAFSHLCKRLGRVACMSDDDFKLYCNKVLSDAMTLEIKYGLRPAEPEVTRVARAEGIRDPFRVRTKGTRRNNQAAGAVGGKKRRKCSTCGRVGHRRTRCPESAIRNSTQEMPTQGSN